VFGLSFDCENIEIVEL